MSKLPPLTIDPVAHARLKTRPGASWRMREVTRLREEMVDPAKAYIDANGIRRWVSNDAIIPPFVYKDAAAVMPEADQAAYKAETAAFLTEYREQQRNREPSAEELFEMRAAFGPGERVVNVITGRVTQL